jgi:hypothetical protein
MEIDQRFLDQLEHSFLQRLNGRGSSTYSSIVLLELCPWLDLAICQSILFQEDQIRVGLDLDEILGQIRICPDPLAITSICNGLRHRTQQIVSMLGLFHMRCRSARNGNLQLLFLHGRMQSLLTLQSDAHAIIKPHGVSSEDPLKDAYPLHLSE